MIRILVVLMATLLPTTDFVSSFDTLPTHEKTVTLADEPQASSFVAVTTLSTSFKQPAAVTVAPTGDVYVADTAHHQIRAIRTDGRVEILAGSGTPGMRDGNGAAAQLASPRGIVFDSTREVLYVADTGNHAIRKVTLDGAVTTVAGNGNPGRSDGDGVSAAFKSPTALAFDPMKDVLYVADTGNSSIRAVTSLATVTTVLAGLKQPEGLALDRDGTLYIADTMNHVIRRLTAGGAIIVAGSGLPGLLDGTMAEARFHEPVGLSVTNDGEIVVADRLNNCLRAVNVAIGSVRTLSGIGQPTFLDGEPTSAGFHAPAGIASYGALWVADEANDAVRMLVPALELIALTPTYGPLTGGEVQLSGSGFIPGRTTVMFGGVAVSARVLSSTQLRVQVPSAAEGIVDVRVTTPAGTRVLTNAYTYVAPPNVDGIDPALGPVAGGVSAIIRGVHFAADGPPEVRFGAATAEVRQWTDKTIDVIVPPAPRSGWADMRVTTHGGEALLSNAYNYLAPPRIDSFSPREGFAGDLVTIVGVNLDNLARDGAPVTLGGIVASVLSDTPTEIVAVVPAGARNARWSVSTIGGVTTSDDIFVVPTVDHVAVTPPAATLAVGETQQFAGQAIYSNGKIVTISSSAHWSSTNPSAVSITTGGLATGITVGSARIELQYGSLSAAADVEVRQSGPEIPADPASIVDDTDPTIPTAFDESIKFLYDGPAAVQSEIQPGAISGERAAVIRGRVADSNGIPLSGVLVSVHDGPSFGHTLSRMDGAFDLVVNGGGDVTLCFAKDGYVPADRRILTRWNEFAVLDGDVRLALYDTAVTAVNLDGLTTPAVAHGSVVDDGDGRRRATLVFNPGTTASLVLPNGTRQPVSQLHVRATDLTIGAIGTMPADLPVESAYTYCVELSADEAVAAGAETVEFSQPLHLYIDNFRNFPVGGAVPLGYYDRRIAQWTAQDNGRIIKLLSNDANGAVEIDINGDGLADNVASSELAISDDERRTLATVFSPGQSLMRVTVSHFSPYDLNWPWGPPTDAVYPSVAQAGLHNPVPGQCCHAGSIIEAESLTLGDSIPIQGTPFTLTYRSRFGAGYTDARAVDIQLSKATLPQSLKRIDLTMTVAGQRHTSSFTNAPNQSTTFTWDGRDVYGRSQRTGRLLAVKIDYVYDTVYRQPADARAFGAVGGNALIENPARREFNLPQTYSVMLEGRRPEQGLGGWLLDAVHAYDPDHHVLRLGDGTDIRLDASAIGSKQAALVQPTVRFMTTGPDGSVYAAAWQCGSIIRLSPNGTVQNLGGGGGATPTTGASAATVRLCAGDMAVAADGRLIVLDRQTQKIFSIASGKVTLLAAVPSTASNFSLTASPHGPVYFTHQNSLYRIDAAGNVAVSAPATDTVLYRTVRAGRDGNLYVAALGTGTQSKRLTISRWAGAGPMKPVLLLNLDRAPTTRVLEGYAADADGRLYYHTDDDELIRVVEPDGATHVFLTARPFIELNAFEIDANDRLVFVDNVTGGRGVYVEDEPIVATGNGWIATVPPGLEAYVFDSSGRHTDTRDVSTGAVTTRMTYDEGGLPVSIENAYGLRTVIERGPAGAPIAIISPTGERTSLELDNGLLTRVVMPDGTSQSFDYDDRGLLIRHVNPNNTASTYAYDDRGRLRHASNSEGRSRDLTVTETATGQTIAVSTGQNRRWQYAVTRTGENITRTTDTPAGLRITSTATPQTTSITLPDGTTVSTTRKADPVWGTMAPYTSSSSVTLPSGRKLSIARAISATLSTASDPLSVSATTETVTVNGKVFTGTYTRADRKLVTRTPLGRVVETHFDGFGRPSEVRTGSASPLTFTYDGRGRLSSLSQNGLRSTIQWDEFDRPSSVTDALNNTVGVVHDQRGRTVRRQLADGSAISFEYDASGNTTALTPPNRPAHHFGYSAANALVSYKSPSSSTTYAYAPDGELVGVSRSDGMSVEYGYDTTGRLQTVSTPAGLYTYSYFANGHIRDIVDPDGGRITRTWDGFLPTSSTWSGAVAGTVSFGWDDNFRLVNETAAGVSVVFAYDADGLLAQAGALTLTRDAATGALTGTTLGVVSDTYIKNADGSETYTATASDVPLTSVNYVRDASGRVRSINDDTFEYDAVGRLTHIRHRGELTEEFAYDANGNRTLHRYIGGSVSATYDDDDRMLAYGDAIYTYRGDGALATTSINGAITEYEYDVFGNLRKVKKAGHLIEYVIDGQNRRTGKKIDGRLVTSWLYSDQLRVNAELDGDGNLVSRFIYGSRSNAPDYMLRGGVAYRIIADHRGSPILIVNTVDGSIAQRLQYDAFGNVLSDSNEGFQPFAFGGGVYDRDTHLVHFGARDYEPHTGRWTAPDPIGFGGGSPNLYVYSYNDPINFADPNGMLSIPFVGWADAGESFGAAAVTSYADTLTDPSASWYELAGAWIGGTFAALWTPCTSDKTLLTLTAAYGANVALAEYGAATEIGTAENQFWRYAGPKSRPNGRWLTRGPQAPYGENYIEAKNALQLPNTPNSVNPVDVKWWEPVRGPRLVSGNEQWGAGGGTEYYRGWFWPKN